MSPAVCDGKHERRDERGRRWRAPALTGLDRVFFTSRGAEANEGAIKLARKRAGHDAAMDSATNGAREKLDRWQRGKRA